MGNDIITVLRQALISGKYSRLPVITRKLKLGSRYHPSLLTTDQLATYCRPRSWSDDKSIVKKTYGICILVELYIIVVQKKEVPRRTARNQREHTS